MFTLKLVIPVMLDETVSVNVAVVPDPGFRVLPSLFQVRVMGPLAPAGFQLVLLMLRVIWLLPVFFTYTLRVTVSPGDSVPQFREVTLVVAELSVYTPTFTVETVPEEETV